MGYEIAGPAWALWASYAAWALLELWVFSRDRRRVEGRSADRGSLIAVAGGIFVAIWLAFWGAGTKPMLRITLGEPALFWIGVALVWAGIVFRLWAISTLGSYFRTTVVVQDEHQLVTAGPYRWLRHPSYTGSIVTMAGLGLALGNWISLAAMLILPTAGYAWRIHVEEQALKARFGDSYAEFSKRTSRIVPGVW